MGEEDKSMSDMTLDKTSVSSQNRGKPYSKPRLHAYGTVVAVTGSNKTVSLCDGMFLTYTGAMTPEPTVCMIAGEG